jgi:hypothetical protein
LVEVIALLELARGVAVAASVGLLLDCTVGYLLPSPVVGTVRELLLGLLVCQFFTLSSFKSEVSRTHISFFG